MPLQYMAACQTTKLKLRLRQAECAPRCMLLHCAEHDQIFYAMSLLSLPGSCYWACCAAEAFRSHHSASST